MSFARSTLWTMMQRYIPSIIHILSTLIITRMLLPSDFGEVALVVTFYQISILLVSSGLGEGLMYRTHNTETTYSTVFFLNLIIAVILYLILFLFSNQIASFYGIERISILTKVIGVNIIVYALSYIQKIQFQIGGRFKKLAIAALVSSIVGSVIGIVLAYCGFGVWAIVIQTVLINLIEMLLLWIYSSWKPLFVFSWEEVKAIIPYSIRILLNNIVTTIYDNLYSLVLGKVYNSKTLGYYNRMQTVVYFTTTNFAYSIEMVFFPLLCTRKDNIKDLTQAYEKLIRMATFFVFPLLCLLIVLAKPVIVLVLTENWIGGVEILQLLSTAFLMVPVIYINNSYLKILGKTDVLFYTNLIKKAIGVIILLVSITYNIRVVCYGIILYYVLDASISILCVKKYLGVQCFSQISFVLPNITINLICMVLAGAISPLITNDFLKVMACSSVFLLLMLLLNKVCSTKEMSLLSVVIKQIRNK